MPTDVIGRRPGCPLPHEDPSDYRLLYPASAGWQHNPSPSSVKSMGNCVIHRVALTDPCIYSAVPYNMVNFIREIYKRHPIARLLGRAMGVLRGINLCLIKRTFPENTDLMGTLKKMHSNVSKRQSCKTSIGAADGQKDEPQNNCLQNITHHVLAATARCYSWS